MIPPAPASQVLGLQAYPTTLSSHNLILLGKLRPKQQAEHLVLSPDLGTLGIPVCFSYVDCCDKTSRPKQPGGGEIISACVPQSQAVIIEEEDQSRNSRHEPGVRNRDHEECRLSACSSWLAQSAFSSHPGSPAQELYCPQWVGPLYINH